MSITTFSFIKLFPIISGRLKRALENQTTKKIFNFIRLNPGLTIAEVSKEQQINRGTLRYHLSQLLAENMIVLKKKGKFSRLFHNNLSISDKENVISRYVKNENSKNLLFAIMDTPGLSNQELSSLFNLAKSTTHDYLKSFSNDGIVESRLDGKYRRYYIMPDAHDILLRFKPQ